MKRHALSLRRSRFAAFVVILTMLLTLSLGAATGVGAQSAAEAVVSPEVIHTGTAPTGYEVAFRYYDPTATNVRLKGEWYFSDAATANASPAASAGRLPWQWQVGDFPIAYPNSPAANWPVHEMTLDAATGVWSFTTPLPSGVFTYAFYKNCPNPAPSLSGCAGFSDPGNPPWNEPVTPPESTEPTSQVFVPSDPAFGTIDYSWQFPTALHGALVDVTYPTSLSTNPPGVHALAVYTPPGYDPNRTPPYPTLYLSHGAGGNEVDWSTQGVAGNIIDNLILTRQVQPMVVVMTNFNGISGGNTGYAQDVVTNVIPYVEANYNVSTLTNDRAFAGLSAGGARANTLFFNYTSAFGAYSVMSNAGGYPAADSPLWQNPALKQVLGLHISAGIDDPIVSRTLSEIVLLNANAIPFVEDLIDGGHEWYVWRIFLRDFAADMAFKHTTTAFDQMVSIGPGGRSMFLVNVKASTTNLVQPNGTVQFYVDGVAQVPVRPVLADGTAKLSLARVSPGPHTITAVYSGDNYYNSSTTETEMVVP